VLVLAAALLAPFIAFVNRGRLGPGALGMDPDSALRLVQVRDLLGGRGGSTDAASAGLGGVEIHWSRLIDGRWRP
jgi:hypothetical protein